MKRLLPIALSVALLVVACSSSVDEAQEAYCDSAETWVESLIALQTLTPTSTREETQEAVEAMESAYDDVLAAAEDYSDAQISEIDAALEEFESPPDGIPEFDTLAEAEIYLDNLYDDLLASVRSTLDTQCPA